MRITHLQSLGIVPRKFEEIIYNQQNFFGGDTLYSSSYSEDTNINVFHHSTS